MNRFYMASAAGSRATLRQTCLLFLLVFVACSGSPLWAQNEPQVKIKLNYGSPYLGRKDRKCRVDITLVNIPPDEYSQAKIMLATDPSIYDAVAKNYKPYASFYEIILPEGDGVKSVYAKVSTVKFPTPTQIAKEDITLDTKSPVLSKVTLNNDSVFFSRADRRVRVSLAAQEADEMYLSESTIPPTSFNSLKWLPFADNTEYAFNSALENKKQLFVILRDKAGNLSQVVAGSITYDKTPPDYTVILVKPGAKPAGGAPGGVAKPGAPATPATPAPAAPGTAPAAPTLEYCNHPEKLVELAFKSKILPPKEVPSDYQVTEDPKFTGAEWKPFAPTATYTLSGEDGLKQVYIRFRDKAGNASVAVQKSIVLDRKAPESYSAKIADGSGYTNKVDATVDFVISKEVAPAAKPGAAPKGKPAPAPAAPAEQKVQYRYSFTQPFAATSWQVPPGAPLKELSAPTWKVTEALKLPGGDGEKIVYLQFRDAAGNESPVQEYKIVLDRKPPVSKTLLIDEGATSTEDKVLDLKITAEDAALMMVADNANFLKAKWEPYAEAKKFTIDGVPGQKTIYVKFKDAAGNESAPVTRTIELLKSAPKAGK